ncbi:Imm10 family immunity protein [Deinococcus sp. QL22]|uniref:Imm10 family immunity protein n=1 Tax=Deinococcus sp. QL22 TaxID=2939437 RepID=UPI002017C447|nr:Imm10 family immunity protein [Deinococcus sp. QL22]UQN06540.1 Imm10 family immunity protein [Deinococcus sp. QL22]
MPNRFTARALAVEELTDLDTFLIALADHADGPTRSLELQKALDAGEDEEHDFDSYCLVVDGAATHSGGVVTCHLTAQTLVLHLNEQAADTLETDGFEIDLDLSEEQRTALRAGLERLFQGDRLAPATLVLE